MKLNIAIILIVATVFFGLWFLGLEIIYAHMLVFGLNAVFVFSSGIHAKLDTSTGKAFIQLFYDNAGWQEPVETICLPLILLLTWLVFLYFHLPARKASMTLLKNLGIFYALQVLYLTLLYGMLSSESVQFIFNLLKNSFGILVLFMIIWDVIRFRISLRNKPVLKK
ncbi:MAG: hypothetical protein CSB01_01590 [Bacteroidia bacterium]|nr:MAG: hypothetical protein CSB01_01590 [Bacteroidia bacterium]